MELTPHLPWTHIFIKLHWGTLLLSVTPFRSSQTPDLSWIINDGRLVWGNTFRWSSFLIQFIGQKGNSVVKKQQQWLCSPDLLMEEQSQLGLEDEVTVTDITHISKQTTQSTDVLACRDRRGSNPAGSNDVSRIPNFCLLIYIFISCTYIHISSFKILVYTTDLVFLQLSPLISLHLINLVVSNLNQSGLICCSSVSSLSSITFWFPPLPRLLLEETSLNWEETTWHHILCLVSLQASQQLPTH